MLDVFNSAPLAGLVPVVIVRDQPGDDLFETYEVASRNYEFRVVEEILSGAPVRLVKRPQEVVMVRYKRNAQPPSKRSLS